MSQEPTNSTSYTLTDASASKINIDYTKGNYFDFDSDDSLKDPTYDNVDSYKISEDYIDTGNEKEIMQEPCNRLSRGIDTRRNFLIDSELNSDIPAATDNEIKNPRKRQRKTEQWVRNVEKNKKNLGKSHISGNGKIIPAKKMGVPCSDKCRKKCSEKFDEVHRKAVFDAFWKLGNSTRQWDFISKYSEPLKPKYRRALEDSTRSLNKSYYLPLCEEKVNVCRLMFLNTLGVSSFVIHTSTRKTSPGGSIQNDKRGKHGKQPRIDVTVRESIKNHINSFPRIESHYRRADSQRNYIDGSLNLASMYRLYVEECKKNGMPSAKRHMYETVFNTEFNISFFKPKKDQCSLCESFLNTSLQGRSDIQDKYDNHIKEKNLSRQSKASDVEKSKSGKFSVVCYDLQAVLTVPNGDISVFYYKRKLNCLNLTFYDVTTKQGYCFLWHEGLANRGANEIGSCVFRYLTDHCKEQGVIFYSDNCVGQNKNKFIFALYLYCVSVMSIPFIEHKFLIVGHTQNEGDMMHSCIERAKKQALRGGPIYIPAQLNTIVRMAKKTGQPFRVQELDTKDILNIKKLSTQIGSNFVKNTSGEKVTWTSVKIIRVEKDSPNIIFYKTSYEQTEFKEIKVLTRISKRKQSIILEPAYENSPGISIAKKQDLLSLCSANAIPSVYHQYFQNLKTSIHTASDDEDN